MNALPAILLLLVFWMALAVTGKFCEKADPAM